MANYSAGSATLDVTPSLDGFADRLRAELARIQVEYRIDVDADVALARAQLEALAVARTATINVGVDDAAAAARLDQLTRTRTATIDVNTVGDSSGPAVSDQTVTIRAELDDAVALARLGELTRDRTVRIGVDVDDAGAAARLDYLARNRTAHINAQVNGGNSLGGIVNNITNITNNTNNVTDAAGRAGRSLGVMGAVKFTGITAGIAALAPALVGAIGAAGALAGALGAIGGAAALGFSGIGGAFKAMKEQANASGADAAVAANKIADAQDGVRRAQDAVVDAQRDAKDAQDDLNASYEKASRALRDMNDQLASAELSQEGAEIALARAQEARAKTYADPKASGLDRAEADHRVKEASQRLKESKSDTADQREDTTAANAKGIGGSDIVQDAKEKKVKADQAAVNAQVDLAKATRELAEAQKGATPGADKYAEALAKLSPNARDFVTQMKALGPQFKELKMAVQDTMFDGLGASVTKFANENMAGLKTTMTGVTGHLNGAFKDTLSSVSGLFQQMAADGTMQRFIAGIGELLQSMAPMITGIVKLVTEAMAAAGPAMGQFFTVLGQTLGDIGPALGQIGGQLLTALTPVLPVLGELIKAISSGLGPALVPLGNLIAVFGQSLIPLAKPLGDLITALANGLAPILPSLGKLLGDLVAAVVPLLPPLLQLATAILQPLITIISSVVQALAPFIKQLAESLGPVIEKIAPVLAEVGKILGEALATAIKELTPVMMPLIDAFLDLVVALLPMLPPIAQIIAELLPILLTHFKVLATVVTKVIEVFTWWVNNVTIPLVLPMLKKVGEWLGDLGKKVGEFTDGFRDKWTKIVDFVTELPGKITNAAKGMWDGLKGNLVDVVNWVLTKWNGLSDSLSFTPPSWVPGTDGKEVRVLPKAELLQKADGGPIHGPGGPRADLIPAMLSNNEYVINSAAVDHYGVGLFDQLNTRKFADGGHATTAPSATSSAPQPYGFKAGTAIDYGQSDRFPEWVQDLEKRFGVLASTYPGHQEIGGLNKGIDWQAPGYPSAGSVDKMQKFAEYLKTAGKNVEQVIWMNQNTGEKIGILNGNPVGPGTSQPGYYRDDWSGHQNHVHTRFSYSIGATPAAPASDPSAPAVVDGQQVDGAYDPTKTDSQDGRSDPQKYTPPTGTGSSGSGGGAKSWSDVAGTFAQSFVSGQVSDLLGVFGIPNSMPPIVTALTELPNRIVKKDASTGDGKTPATPATSTTGAGGTATNPFGEMMGKFIPGLAGIPGFSSTPTPAAPVTPTAPSTTVDGKPTAPAAAAFTAPAANYSGGTPEIHNAAYKAFKESGLPGAEWAPLVQLINNESGWRPTVKNPGSTAYGLGQFLDSTWATVGATKTEDPHQQTALMIKYIKQRPDYGTPSKALQMWESRSPHWYANGGFVSGPGGGKSDLIRSFLSHGEFVVNSVAAGMNMPLLEAINSGAQITTPARQAPAASFNAAQASANQRPGNTTNFNISTARVEDAFMQAQLRQNQDRAAQLATL